MNALEVGENGEMCTCMIWGLEKTNKWLHVCFRARKKEKWLYVCFGAQRKRRNGYMDAVGPENMDKWLHVWFGARRKRRNGYMYALGPGKRRNGYMYGLQSFENEEMVTCILSGPQKN